MGTGTACVCVQLILDQPVFIVSSCSVGGALVPLSPLITYMCHVWVCKVNTSKIALSSSPNPLPNTHPPFSCSLQSPQPSPEPAVLLLFLPDHHPGTIVCSLSILRSVPGRAETPGKCPLMVREEEPQITVPTGDIHSKLYSLICRWHFPTPIVFSDPLWIPQLLQ